MKVLRIVAVLLIAATLSSCGSKTAGVHADVMAVLNAQQAAWNNGDMKGYFSGYLQSDTTRFVSGGTLVTGWNTLYQRFLKSYPDKNAMGLLRFIDVRIDVLSGDAAVAYGKWVLTREDGRPWGMFTLIFRRTKDGWKIVHDHTSSSRS